MKGKEWKGRVESDTVNRVEVERYGGRAGG